MFSMFSRWRARHRIIGSSTLLSLIAIAAITASVALAAWLVDSTSNPGKGAVGTLVAPTVTAATSAGGTALYPGAAGDLTFHMVNSNTIPVKITGWVDGAGSLSAVVDAGHSAACSGGLLDVYDNVAHQGFGPNAAYAAGVGVTGLSIAVPVGASDITIPNVVGLATAAPTGCQGATFTTGATAYVIHFSS